MSLNDRIANKVTQENWKQYSDAWRFREETYPGLASAQSVRQSRDLGWPTDFKIHTEKTGATNTIFFDRVAKLGRGIVGDQELILPPVEPSPSPSLSPSVSPSLSPSGSLSPSVSPSLSPSVSPSGSLSPSVSPSSSLSPSPSPSLSPSVSPSGSPLPSPSPSPSGSPWQVDINMTVTWSDGGIANRTLLGLVWTNGETKALIPTDKHTTKYQYGMYFFTSVVWDKWTPNIGIVKLNATYIANMTWTTGYQNLRKWELQVGLFTLSGVPFGSQAIPALDTNHSFRRTLSGSTLTPSINTSDQNLLSYGFNAPFIETGHKPPYIQDHQFGHIRISDGNAGWIDVAWNKA